MYELFSTQTNEELISTHKNWSYMRTDRNGTRYFADHTCQRCGGAGRIQGYYYIEGGVCFECGGKGIGSKPETVKVYTPEHYAELQAGREARAIEHEKAEAARLEAEWPNKLRKAGFEYDEDADEWYIYRIVGNTYSIKDELKAKGCKYNRAVGWYHCEPLDGYNTQKLLAEDVLTDNHKCLTWRPEDEVKDLWIENMAGTDAADDEVAQSEYQGQIGERIEREFHIDMVIKGGQFYGKQSYFLIMSDKDGNKYTWSTSCYYPQDSTVTLRGTVKEHKDYIYHNQTIKQTVLTRCTKVG